MPKSGGRLTGASPKKALRNLLRALENCGWLDPIGGEIHGRVKGPEIAEAYRTLGEKVPDWVGNPRSTIKFLRIE